MIDTCHRPWRSRFQSPCGGFLKIKDLLGERRQLVAWILDFEASFEQIWERNCTLANVLRRNWIGLYLIREWKRSQGSSLWHRSRLWLFSNPSPYLRLFICLQELFSSNWGLLSFCTLKAVFMRLLKLLVRTPIFWMAFKIWLRVTKESYRWLNIVRLVKQS